MTNFLSPGLGSVSSSGTPSTDTTALSQINSQNQTFTNQTGQDDFIKNISYLNNATDVLAQWSKKLQAGVDQSNSNALEQVQGIYSDLFVLLAGFTPTGIDVGNLKYVLQGIGAMFGVNPGTPFPMNLFDAAWNLFDQYIVPSTQFTDVIFEAIDGWALSFGLSQQTIDTFHNLQTALEGVSASLSDLFKSIQKLMDAFGPDLAPLLTLFDDFTSIFANVAVPVITPIIQTLVNLGLPFINALTAIVNGFNSVLTSFGLTGLTNSLSANICPIPSATTTIWTVGSDGATQWLFDTTHKANTNSNGSFTTLANGVSKSVKTQSVYTANPGAQFVIKGQIYYTGIPAGVTGFGVELIWVDINGIETTSPAPTRVKIDQSHTTDSGSAWIALTTSTIVVPQNVVSMKIAAYVDVTMTTGQVWVDAISVQEQTTSSGGGLTGLFGSFLPTSWLNSLAGGTSQTNIVNYFSGLLNGTSTLTSGNLSGLIPLSVIPTGIPQASISGLTSVLGTFLTAASSLAGGNLTGTVPVGTIPTGIPQANISGLTSILGTFLTSASSLASGNLSGLVPLSLIPTGIPQASISGLASTLATYLTSSSSIALGQLPTGIPQANISGLVSQLGTYLTSASNLVGANLTGTVPLGTIPTGIPQGNISGLTSTLATFLTAASSLSAGNVTGVLGTGNIPNITKAMSTDLQGVIDGVYQAVNGGTSTNNTLASVKTSLLAFPGGNIVGSLASSLLSGIIPVGLIPTGIPQASISGLVSSLATFLTSGSSLTAGNLTGTAPLGVIPTGIPQASISGLTSTLSSFLTAASSLAAGNLTGTVPVGTIPTGIPQASISGLTSLLSTFLTGSSSLSSSNLNGLLPLSLIPTGIPQGSISGLTSTLGTFLTAASSLNSGNLSGLIPLVNIPGLPTSQITSGTFLSSIMPMLGLSNSKGSNIVLSPQFENNAAWTSAAGVMSSAQKHSGVQSRLLTATGAALPLQLMNDDTGPQTFKVKPTDIIYVEGYVFPKITNTGGGQLKALVTATDSTGTNAATDVQAALITVPATGAWAKISGFATVPSGYDTANPKIQLQSNIPSGDQIYIDDVVVQDQTQTQNIISQMISSLGGAGTGLSGLNTVLTAIPFANMLGSAAVSQIPSGIPQANISGLTSVLGTFLTAASSLASGNLTGTAPLSVIPTGIPQASISGLTSTLGTFLTAASSFAGANVTGTLPVGTIPTGIPQASISGLTSQLATYLTAASSFAAANLTGVAPVGTIPNLPASLINSGVFGSSLIPNVTKAMSTDLQGVIDNAYQASNGGSSVNNTLASFKTSLLNIPGANIVSALGLGVIPALPASQISSGTLALGLIPTGIPQASISGLVSGLAAALTSASSLTAGNLTGTVPLGTIPTGIPQANISGLTSQLATYLTAASSFAAANLTGTAPVSVIPGLPASILTSGTITETVTGLNTLRDSITAGLGLVGSGFTNTQAQNQAAQISHTANAAASSAAAANATLQQSTTTTNTPATGSSYTFPFSGSDGAALASADFSGSNIVIRSGSNNSVGAGILASLGNGNDYYTIEQHQVTTDGQSVSVTLGDQGGATATNLTIYFHCNSTMTAGGYCSINNGGFTIGYFTMSGGTFTKTPFAAATSMSLQTGYRIELRNVSNLYQVYVNGTQQFSYTDSSNHVTMDASHRYAGFSMDRTTTSGWFGSTTYDAFRATAFTFSDYSPTTALGAGTLTQITSTSTWTNPTPTQHKLVTVICVNGGQGGSECGSSSLQSSLGGINGGWTAKQFYTDALSSTVACTVGAAGAGATSVGAVGAIGGVTSFGSYLSGVSDVGYIINADGTYTDKVAFKPGNGGNGMRAGSSAPYMTIPNTPGQPSAFAAGGIPTNGAGATGGAAPVNSTGGGGGGGGGAQQAVGGVGGFPGGGGGGGSVYATNSPAGGGAGAAGCIYIITY